jgi:cell division protein FtsQ
MARRGVTEEMEFPLLERQAEAEETEERPTRRAPRSIKKERERQEGPPKRRTINLFYWALPFIALVVAFGFVLAFHRVEAFLINDERFHLPVATDFGQDPPNLKMGGLKRASKPQILRIFEQDFGRSLYLTPIAERRRSLLAVHWVKEAAVSRRWPNQIHIAITEREPVAFAQIDVRNSAPRFFLVDIDGVLLPIPKGEKFDSFVVLTGLTGNEPEASRRLRVQQVVAMQKEVGPLAGYISELDVRDPGNLRATLQINGGVAIARLGSQNYRQRLQNFLKHYPRIREERPDAKTFDLRIDDRITAVEGAERGE